MDGVHNRRARPTLRVLREDLTSDWDSALPRRALADNRLSDLHPLSELPHPIVAKAMESFGPDNDNDNYVGPIGGSTRLPLLEIKQSQWRGGVWIDSETGVCWLVVAGLAKGDHEDRDDFYKQVARADRRGSVDHLLPNDADVRLLKQETAARLRTEWELEAQRTVLDALRSVHSGGEYRARVHHPIPGVGDLAHVSFSVEAVREDDYRADEITVEITPEPRFAASDLLWQLTIRILISIDPPEQGWDRYGDIYSNIADPGAWAKRREALATLVTAGDLALSEPGSMSHYTHRESLSR